MELNIAFAINNAYTQHCGVTIRSIVLNNRGSQFRFHIICSDRLSDKNRERLKKTIGRGNLLEIYEEIFFENINFKIDGHASIDNYSRLFLGEILSDSIKQVLYLDCDLVVLGDLTGLWKIDLSSKAAAVVHHSNQQRSEKLGISPDQYFNSGVMFINLEFFRKKDVLSACIQFINDHPDLIKFWDQDVLNSVLNQKVEYLPIEYNLPKTKEIKKNTKVLHYTGTLKPWHVSYPHPNRLQYFKYLMRTKWGFEFFPKFVRDFVHSKVRHAW